MSLRQDLERIHDSMRVLLDEARWKVQQITDSQVRNAAEAYWLATVDAALGGGDYDNPYDTTMLKTIETLPESTEDEEG